MAYYTVAYKTDAQTAFSEPVEAGTAEEAVETILNRTQGNGHGNDVFNYIPDDADLDVYELGTPETFRAGDYQ